MPTSGAFALCPWKEDFEYNIMVSESLILTGRTTMGYTSLLERNSSKIKKSKQKKNQNYFPLQNQKVQNKY